MCLPRLILVEDRGETRWVRAEALWVDQGTDPELIAGVAGLALRAAVMHWVAGAETDAVRRTVLATLRRALEAERPCPWSEETLMAAAQRQIDAILIDDPDDDDRFGLSVRAIPPAYEQQGATDHALIVDGEESPATAIGTLGLRSPCPRPGDDAAAEPQHLESDWARYGAASGLPRPAWEQLRRQFLAAMDSAAFDEGEPSAVAWVDELASRLGLWSDPGEDE
jgi:hypothetical protein